MFILMVSRGVPTERYPQWGCFEKDQAEALVSLGHKVIVASVDSRFLLHWRKIGIQEVIRNNVVFYNSFLIPSAITQLLGRRFDLVIKQWQMKRIYEKVLNKYGKPDVICGHFSFSTCNAVKVAITNDIPLIGIEHNAIFNEETLSKLTHWTANYAYQYTQKIISVSRNLQERIKYHLNKDSIVVYNTFGEEFLNATCAKAPNKFIRFVATGNLIYRKGYDLLIRAFAELNLPRETWSLDIIGDGEEKLVLNEKIVSCNLQENISLLGKKNKKEIVDLLIHSHVFMMPSRNENFSVAILEALACGLPIIASDCGGVRDCIDSSNGIIFPVDDVDSLKKAILQVYEHEVFFDNLKIAEQCRRRFAPKVVAQNLINVFEKVIEEHKCSNDVNFNK